MKARVLVIPLVLGLFLLPACQEKRQAAVNQTPGPIPAPAAGLIAAAQRATAPPVLGASLDGSSWSLADRKGKVVIIDFWATWCGPCRMTIPHLIDLQKEYGSKGLEIIGISLDRGGKEVVGPFVKQIGINYPVIVDEPGKFAAAYGGVDAIPAFFVIDRSGRIAMHSVGAGPKEDLARAVAALLSEG